MACDENENSHRLLRDYAVPTVQATTSSIRRLAVQVNNFEIKPSLI